MSDDIQGWFNYENIYNRMVDEVRDGGTIIELGVWKGRSIVHLGRRVKESGKRIRVVGIDKWTHNEWDGYHRIIICDNINGESRSVEQQCKDNIAAAGLSDIVQLIKGDSIESAALFDDGSVDFVWFDDTHNSEHVQREIAAWIPKARRPTWWAGHDFPGDIEAGVRHHFPHATQDGTSWIATIQ